MQARTANAVSEITGITNSTGAAWAQPDYDPAGNMTTIPQPAHDVVQEQRQVLPQLRELPCIHPPILANPDKSGNIMATE